MTEPDIRWVQRLDQLTKTLTLLENTISIESPSVAEKLGAVKLFEMTFELAWKLLKDYEKAEGLEARSPRAVIKQALQINLIRNGHSWLEALETRNLMIHTYDESESTKVIKKIEDKYLALFRDLRDLFLSKIDSMEKE